VDFFLFLFELKIRTRDDDVVRDAATGCRRSAVAMVYDSVRRRTTVVVVVVTVGTRRPAAAAAARRQRWSADVQTERQQQQTRQSVVERRAKEQPSAAAKETPGGRRCCPRSRGTLFCTPVVFYVLSRSTFSLEPVAAELVVEIRSPTTTIVVYMYILCSRSMTSFLLRPSGYRFEMSSVPSFYSA